MGSAASMGVGAACKVASDADLTKLFKDIPQEERLKLKKVLEAMPDKSSEKNTTDEAKKEEASPPATEAAKPTPAEGKEEAKPQADTGATASEDAPAEKPAEKEEPPVDLDPAQTAKIHSAIRWGKKPEEVSSLVTTIGISMSQAIAVPDTKNGNRCLHIAAQNGHLPLVKFLVSQKANVNVQNGKGQTPLHMSIEYDFYYQSKFLLDSGADPKIANGDGHEALKGLEGGKTGKEAWDNPVTILKAAGDNVDELNFALAELEKADSGLIDKASLVQTGMAKKRNCKDNWDAKRFMSIVQKID
mmetsp:Transcript_38387/g.86512  ORF Transcript_38387/g.86512 Transcript_38387/m.86512 type:complete len:302 (-) Transcript_38387:145-1050(-)